MHITGSTKRFAPYNCKDYIHQGCSQSNTDAYWACMVGAGVAALTKTTRNSVSTALLQCVCQTQARNVKAATYNPCCALLSQLYLLRCVHMVHDACSAIAA